MPDRKLCFFCDDALGLLRVCGCYVCTACMEEFHRYECLDCALDDSSPDEDDDGYTPCDIDPFGADDMM